MQMLTIECWDEEKDFVLAELAEAGTLGVTETARAGGGWILEAWFEDGVEGLAGRFPDCGGVVRRPDPVDWVAVSRAQWRPLEVGERLFLAPSWDASPTPEGRLRLTMPAGAAAGTGLHAATQLALRGLEAALRAGDTVLDLGTGSGILASAARLLGAGRVVACDIDPEAAAAARDYLAGGALVFAGSCRSLRGASADLVVANLSAQAFGVVAHEITRVLKPGGRAVLTGFPAAKCGRVEKILAGAGLVEDRKIEAEGYSALISRKATAGGG
jgi:ribosomal protein L11 methyltransferase